MKFGTEQKKTKFLIVIRLMEPENILIYNNFLMWICYFNTTSTHCIQVGWNSYLLLVKSESVLAIMGKLHK